MTARPAPYSGAWVGKLAHLQGLRALAASAVVAGHAWQMLIDRGLLPAAQTPLTWMAGQIGVTVFFVISGLIMTRSGASSFGRPDAPGSFLLKRAIRIAPMYWLATLAIAAVQGAHGAPPAALDLVRSFLFIPYRAEGAVAVRPVLGLGWTLNCEAVFYLVFAGGLVLPKRLGLAAVLGGLVGVVALGALARPLAPYADPTTPAAFITDPILLRFGAGVLLGWAELSGAAPPRRTPAPLLLAVAVLTALGLAFWRAGATFPLGYGWQAALTAGAALAVWLCTSPGATAGWIGHVLERAGDASYSTYLFQTFGAQAALGLALLAPHAVRPPWLLIGLAVLGANLLGWIVFTAVEKPLTERLRKLFDLTRPEEWRSASYVVDGGRLDGVEPE